jgi:cytochrome P450
MVSQLCPVSSGVDWLGQDFLAEPFDVLARLRAESPVFYDPELGHYLVTRYADVEEVLRDRATFLAANASASIWPPSEAAQQVLRDSGYRRVPTLNNADPPRHAPMRKATRTCMTPRRMATLEPDLRTFARGLVTDLAARDEVDLVETLADPLPAHAGLGLLGFPDEAAQQILAWSDKRVLFTYGHLPDDEQVDVARSVVSFWKFIEEFVHEKVADPGDDFTSDLLHYREENPEVTMDDVVNIVYSLALAGHDSTSNAIANTLRRLLAVPEQWKALCAEPEAIPNAVEEGLRFDPPVMGHRRLAATDTEIGGVAVPAGAKLVLLFASAGRDARHFAHPDAFDVHRANAVEHLTFGKGVHFCLGAPLARLELRIVLELLTELTPEMQLVEGQTFEYSPNALFRSLRALLVTPGRSRQTA